MPLGSLGIALPDGACLGEDGANASLLMLLPLNEEVVYIVRPAT